MGSRSYARWNRRKCRGRESAPRSQERMPCLECGNPATCRAHIIPGAIGKDIIKASSDRKTLSLAAPNRTNDFIQSGFFDESILCATCDKILGIYDAHAIEVVRLLGTQSEALARDSF